MYICMKSKITKKNSLRPKLIHMTKYSVEKILHCLYSEKYIGFHSSPFLTKWVLLEICLVCLMSLQLFSIHKSDFLSNIMRWARFGITSAPLFRNLLFSILKCARAATAMYDVLYSLSALYLETGPGTCVQWLIIPIL